MKDTDTFMEEYTVEKMDGWWRSLSKKEKEDVVQEMIDQWGVSQYSHPALYSLPHTTERKHE